MSPSKVKSSAMLGPESQLEGMVVGSEVDFTQKKTIKRKAVGLLTNKK